MCTNLNPVRLCREQKITEIVLQRYGIREMPEAGVLLKPLRLEPMTTLSLDYNQLQSIPDCLGALPFNRFNPLQPCNTLLTARVHFLPVFSAPTEYYQGHFVAQLLLLNAIIGKHCDLARFVMEQHHCGRRKCVAVGHVEALGSETQPFGSSFTPRPF